MKDSTPLRDFLQRINFRKGRVSVISATARKLAVIIWNMIFKKEQYVSKTAYVFLDEKKDQLTLIRKKIAKFGFDPNELGIFSQERYRIKYEKSMTEN